MPLEATMLVCVRGRARAHCRLDNSEWMRNGDYPPSRWGAQSDAVNILFDAKTNANPESMVGLMTMGGKSPEVLVTLTHDIGKIFAALHNTKLDGSVNLSTGINIAQLALKHRQNKNQRQRVVVFVGSPVADTEESLVALGKKLKKNNVAVDVVSFGESEQNQEKLAKLVETVDSSDNSHLLTVPVDTTLLADTLIASPILMEGAAGDAGAAPGTSSDYQFGVDPNMDPELAMALRMSLEEEQARQRAVPQTQPAEGATGSLVPTDAPPLTGTAGLDTDMAHEAQSEDALLGHALDLSRGAARDDVPMEAAEQPTDAPAPSDSSAAQPPAPAELDRPAPQTSRATVAGANDGDDDEEMTEDEAIARAIEMSLKDAQGTDSK
ncbi:proteasome regulatory particle base subunit rpn10 [Malassezia sp. CBS 17886]|nr:proteasome regulatory particle base subunit rpn10 [Malassezia sp. CBS 17886]